MRLSDRRHPAHRPDWATSAPNMRTRAPQRRLLARGFATRSGVRFRPRTQVPRRRRTHPHRRTRRMVAEAHHLHEPLGPGRGGDGAVLSHPADGDPRRARRTRPAAGRRETEAWWRHCRPQRVEGHAGEAVHTGLLAPAHRHRPSTHAAAEPGGRRLRAASAAQGRAAADRRCGCARRVGDRPAGGRLLEAAMLRLHTRLE